MLKSTGSYINMWYDLYCAYTVHNKYKPTYVNTLLKKM